MSVLKVVSILIENSQLGDNIPKSFGLTIPNVLQLLSQPGELYVKINILIAKIFYSRKSSPYELYVKINILESHLVLLFQMYSNYFHNLESYMLRSIFL